MPSTVIKMMAFIGADTREAEQGMKRVSNEARDVEKGFSGAAGGARAFRAGLAGLAVRAAGMLGVLYGIKQAITLGVEFNAMKEQAEIAFTTMLGGAREATTMMQQLQEFAARTPFEFERLIPSTQRLMAFGFEAQRIIPMLRNIGDAVAGLGGGEEMINRVTLALGQMQAKGVVAAQEMMQLTEAGIPAWEYLARALDTDVAGAMKLVEQRTVDAGTAIDAVLAGMERDFGGMMEEQSRTWDGLWSTIHDTWQQIAGELTEPIVLGAKGPLEKLVTTLDKTLALIREAKEELRRWQLGVEQEKKAAEGLPLITKGEVGERRPYRYEMQIRQAPEVERLRQLQEQAEKLRADIARLEEEQAEWGLSETDLMMLEGLRGKLAEIEEQARLARLELQNMQAQAGYTGSALIDTWMPGQPWSGPRNIGVYEPTWVDVGEDTERLKYEGRVQAERESDRRVRVLQYEQAQEYGKQLQRAIEDAHRKARSRVESILFTPSQVTERDMRQTRLGIYEEKPDEYVRRLEAAAQDAQSPWRKMLVPEEILAQGEDAIQEWIAHRKEMFYAGMLPEEVNWDAFASEFQRQAQMEASREALIQRGMQELAARGIQVSEADVRGMLEPGTGAAQTWTEQIKKSLETQSPVTILLAQINTEMTEKVDDIKKSGTTFFETFLSGVNETKQTTISWLINILLPGIIAELEYLNYAGGGEGQ